MCKKVISVCRYSTGIIMCIGLHVQYRYYYAYRSACTVPVLLCISVCTYSTGIIMYIGLHVQYRYYYVYRSACTVPVLLCISVCMYRTGYSCRILMKLVFSRHIFEKYSDIKFHENPSNDPSCSMRKYRQTDKDNNRFPQCFEKRLKHYPKNQ